MHAYIHLSNITIRFITYKWIVKVETIHVIQAVSMIILI